jgi:ankyrin repeat protein
MVKYMCSCGADVNSIDCNGVYFFSNWAALHFAASKEHLEVIKILLSFQANINLSRKVLFFYLPRRSFSYHMTPLAISVEKGFVEIAEFLINQGALVNLTNAHRQTPLHIAAKKGIKEMIELLVTRNANLSFVDSSGEVPLFFAVRASKIDAVDELARNGFDMATTNSQRQTALHIACQTGSLPIVQRILEAQADIDARDSQGNTPLHLATMNEHHDITRYLLMHRADATIRNLKNRSPFFYASVEGAKLFRQHFQADGSVDKMVQAAEKQRSGQSTPSRRSRQKGSAESSVLSTPKLTRQSSIAGQSSLSSGTSPSRRSGNESVGGGEPFKIQVQEEFTRIHGSIDQLSRRMQDIERQINNKK